MRKPFITVVAVLAAFSLSSSYPDVECGKAVVAVNGVRIKVEVASTARARETGLMHRRMLPEGAGMLFVYPDERIAALWMKDTYIPLSAAFIKEDGVISQIIYMEKTRSAKIYRSKEKVKYVLEVPLGYFERNGIKAGDYCDITYLDEAS